MVGLILKDSFNLTSPSISFLENITTLNKQEHNSYYQRETNDKGTPTVWGMDKELIAGFIDSSVFLLRLNHLMYLSLVERR